jgi:hypothetical protein
MNRGHLDPLISSNTDTFRQRGRGLRKDDDQREGMIAGILTTPYILPKTLISFCYRMEVFSIDSVRRLGSLKSDSFIRIT